MEKASQKGTLPSSMGSKGRGKTLSDLHNSVTVILFLTIKIVLVFIVLASYSDYIEG